MKKWSFLLAAVLLMFLSSLGSPEKTGATVGEQAPYMEITNDLNRVSLSNERGKYIVLNFWSAKDAQSRIDNALYDRALSSDVTKDVSYISVCMDDDETLWKQIIKADNLKAATQYQAKDSRMADFAEKFNVESSCRSYLISPQGEILAMGLDVTQTLAMLPSRS